MAFILARNEAEWDGDAIYKFLKELDDKASGVDFKTSENIIRDSMPDSMKYSKSTGAPRLDRVHPSFKGATMEYVGFGNVDSEKVPKCKKCNVLNNLMLCPRCKGAMYCSKMCQKNDWNVHQIHCRQFPAIPKK